MSSIHYKFRATLEYKTLSFDGLSILSSELKREICAKENIKAEAFDLVLQNAHTKRQYAADEQIPRNISIIVQRVPKEDGEKLPKIQGVNTGMVQRADAAIDSGINVTGHIMQSEFDKLTEEERLTHIKTVSTTKYDASNYQKRPSGALTGPPPPTYTCNRCHQPGHWFKNCPLLNQKRTTGIPSQELMETTADDPQAMLHPSGKYVIPIMHWRARQHKKNVEGTPVLEKMPPKELICPLCDHLFKDAVVTTCCGISFCADCISQSLLESEDRNCPGENCNKTQVSVDSLVPNRMLRQMVSNWEAGGAAGDAPERVRIGLAPSSNLASSSSLAGRSPSAQVPQPPVSSVPVATTAPSPAVALPQQHIPIPASFSQPPPNMMVMAPPAEQPLAPPGTTSLVSSLTPAPLVPSVLPPIPGVQMMDTTYTTASVSNYAWEACVGAFLNRNSKPVSRDRDYGRRRKRSRERRRSRSPSEDRKRSRRGRDRDDRRDRDRSKERSKKRDYDSKDSHRSRHKTDADSDKERKRRKEKYEDRSPEKKPSKEKDDKPDVDEEAAIDDALKEVEELNMLRKSDGSEEGDVDAGMNISKSPKEQGSQSETSDRGGTSEQPSPDITKSSELESTPVKMASPRNRSSDSESTQGKSEEAEKMEEESDKEKSDHEEGKKDDDSDKGKRKKDKKAKKHKKEKKHKKDRNETEEERKERKKLKKEKKEKKRREKEENAKQKDKERKRRHSDSDDEKERQKSRKERKEEKYERDSRDKHRHRDKERSSRHDMKEDRSKSEKRSRNENETDEKDSKKAKTTKLEALAATTKDDFSASREAKVDEKQIRDHFSPPPTLLQTKKITLNI